jgi:hypothetical protein
MHVGVDDVKIIAVLAPNYTKLDKMSLAYCKFISCTNDTDGSRTSLAIEKNEEGKEITIIDYIK